MAKRELRHIGSALQKLRNSFGPDSKLAEIQSVWIEAVGEVNAKHGQPFAERDGVVRVRCSSSVWAQELTMIGQDLVEQINQHLDTPWLVSLSFSSS